jgi:hypothetical protein
MGPSLRFCGKDKPGLVWNAKRDWHARRAAVKADFAHATQV